MKTSQQGRPWLRPWPIGAGLAAAALLALLVSTPVAADGDSVFIFDAPAKGATESTAPKDVKEKPAAEADDADSAPPAEAVKERKRKTPTKKRHQ